MFELSPKAGGGWSERLLHSFGNGSDGFRPWSNLVFDGAGNLYGTTPSGGLYATAYTGGTVFELRKMGAGWVEWILHSFAKGTDGSAPYAGLVFDTVGNLYGTTSTGGSGKGGTVFELTPDADGDWTESILHNFTFSGGDGTAPYSGVILDGAGNLYGTTSDGGTAYCTSNTYCGTVFELMPAGGGNWTETIVHDFLRSRTDGYGPQSSLIFDGAGNLYGTTYQGGAYSYGAVFEVSPATGGGWTEKLVHSFGQGKDGNVPYAGLIFDSAGNLYGATTSGGSVGSPDYYGTVFEITP